jgi:hypothetical protein
MGFGKAHSALGTGYNDQNVDEPKPKCAIQDCQHAGTKKMVMGIEYSGNPCMRRECNVYLCPGHHKEILNPSPPISMGYNEHGI